MIKQVNNYDGFLFFGNYDGFIETITLEESVDMLEILRGLVIENDFVCNVALFYTQVWRYFQFKL